MFEGLRKQFRQITMSSFQRDVERNLCERYPEARQVLDTLEHPKVILKNSRSREMAYLDDAEHVVLMTLEDSDISDEADRVYGELLKLMEIKGLATEEMKDRRQEIYAHHYADGDGNRTRFTYDDVSVAAPDRGKNILKGCFDFLESLNVPGAQLILDTMRDNHTAINLVPVADTVALAGSFIPDRNEFNFFYDVDLPDTDVVAQTALKILHEGTHLYQKTAGLLSENVSEADNFREVSHLNELQAHTIQYLVPLELLQQLPVYEDFKAGYLSIQDLADDLERSDDVVANVCRRSLCGSHEGASILGNIQSRFDAGMLSDMPPELLVKESLCRGEIDKIEDGQIIYDQSDMTRMQRYAHSHITVMNFGSLGDGGDKASVVHDIVGGHFQGPLGLSVSGNTVDFVSGDFVFTSAVTHRQISVQAIEYIWGKYGGENTQGLGFKSEELLGAGILDKLDGHKKSVDAAHTLSRKIL